MSYRPLPDCLRIDDSQINGQGLIATKDIPAGTELGVTHIFDSRWPDGLIRTPLGGHYNHSVTPNAETYEYFHPVYQAKVLCLRTLEDIKSGDELTCTYTAYDPTK